MVFYSYLYFVNILFVGFQNEFEKKLPKLSKKIESNQKKDNNLRKNILEKTNTNLNKVIKKFNKKILK